jgi:hypothetical protein
MSFFAPVIDSKMSSNAFGSGIYTTEDFETACTYAGHNGAIMVFRNLDRRNLAVWRPDHEWNQLVTHWLALGVEVGTARMPAECKRADVIIVPSPSGLEQARRKKCHPSQNREVMQTSFASYGACERLIASLWAII